MREQDAKVVNIFVGFEASDRGTGGGGSPLQLDSAKRDAAIGDFEGDDSVEQRSHVRTQSRDAIGGNVNIAGNDEDAAGHFQFGE